MLKALILALICSVLSLLMHLVITLFRKGRPGGEPLIFELMHQAKTITLIWVTLFIIYTRVFFFTPKAIIVLVDKLNHSFNLIGFVYGIFFYLALSFTYLTFYYVFNRSVSATILEIIEASVDKKLTVEQIKNVYNTDKKYLKELKGMSEGGFIVEENGLYRNSLKGRAYAGLAKFIKRFFKLGAGG